MRFVKLNNKVYRIIHELKHDYMLEDTLNPGSLSYPNHITINKSEVVEASIDDKLNTVLCYITEKQKLRR